MIILKNERKDVLNPIQRDIVNYIYENKKIFGINTKDDVMEITKFLVASKKFSRQSIISGKYDDIIKLLLDQRKMVKRSVMTQAEKITAQKIGRKMTELKTKKIIIDRDRFFFILKSLSITAGIVVLIVLGKLGIDFFNDYRLSSQVSENIGSIISTEGNTFNRDIVEKNTGVENINGNIIKFYKNNKIAEDLIKVFTENPSFFDVSLFNTYKNMKFNKLHNMDLVLKNLKDIMREDSAFEALYQNIKDCDTFLDYLVKKGFLDPNDPDYYKILPVVEKYRLLSVTRSDVNEIVYLKLSKEERELIDTITDKYSENKNMYEEYVDEIKEAARKVDNGEGRK